MGDLELRAIRDDEKGTLVDLLVAAFPDDPAATWRRVVDDLWGDFEHTRVGVVDGEIVSTVQIFRYSMRLDEAVFDAGAIAHVATRPDIKGAAYAGRVLRDAIDVMKRDGMAVTILVTDIPRYYNRYGWWLVPEKGFRIGIGDEIAVDSAYGIEPLDLDKHYDAVSVIHEETSAAANGTTPRSRKMWFTESPWEPDDPARSAVAVRNGEVVGYVRARAGRLRIVGELASRDAQAGAALLTHLMKAAREGGEPALRGKFPLDEEVAAKLRARGHAVEAEFPCGPDGDFEITMVGFLDLAGFFKQFEGALQRRAEAAGYKGDASIAVKCRAGTIGIEAKGGKISTSGDLAEDAEEIKLKDARLVEIICTADGIADATLPEGVSDEGRELLEAIRATRDFVLWLPDHF